MRAEATLGPWVGIGPPAIIALCGWQVRGRTLLP